MLFITQISTTKRLEEVKNNIIQPREDKLEEHYKKENNNKWILLGIGLVAFGLIGYLIFKNSENKINMNISPSIKIKELNNTNKDKQTDILKSELTQIKQELNTSNNLMNSIQKELFSIASNATKPLIKEENMTAVTVPVQIDKEEKRIYKVKEGDNLSSIAKKFYHDENKYNRIISANKKIKDKYSTLYIGQEISIPK